MTPTRLREIGDALYGERWQSPLARALAVSDRTVRRWAAGEWPVPARVAEELDALLARRGAEIRALRRA